MVYIKEIKIKDFRLIKEMTFKPSQYVNVISGKNGTGKSTILGMIAQGFSFNNKVVDFVSEKCNLLNKTKINSLKNSNSEENKKLIEEYDSILTYFGKNFESSSDEHFKLSKKDIRNTEHINITLDNNRYFKVESTNHTDRKLPRFVTRRDDKKSSNYVHPVIYLGLDRLTPLVKTKNENFNLNLSESDKLAIHNLYESILLKRYPKTLTATITNEKKQTAAYIDPERTIEMISSGEDIIGQLLLALFSFKKLKDTYPNDYKGGLLLIDEVDATLYPAAQNKLLDIFLDKARAWDIQIFVTSHSLTLLEHLETIKLNNSRVNRDIKIFTTNESENSDIILTELEYLYKFKNQLLVQANKSIIPDKIKVYFEDSEAYFIFKNLIKGLKDSNNEPIHKRLQQMKNIKLGCNNYIQLHNQKIPEFSAESMICIDGDNKEKINKFKSKNKLKNFITLPTHKQEKSNPEEFIFDIINDPLSDYWKQTDDNYNHSIYMNNPKYRIITSIKNGTYEEEYKNQNGQYYNTEPRKVWKAWFKIEQTNWKGKNNPISYWKSTNKDDLNNFFKELETAFNFVAKNNKIPKL